MFAIIQKKLAKNKFTLDFRQINLYKLAVRYKVHIFISAFIAARGKLVENGFPYHPDSKRNS